MPLGEQLGNSQKGIILLREVYSLDGRCPHHGIPSWELEQTFWGLNDNERNTIDIWKGYLKIGRV